MNSDTHPLIAATEARFEALGKELSPLFHKRVTELVRLLSLRFGPFGVIMGMGGWGIVDTNGAKMNVKGDGWEDVYEIDLDQLDDWADRNDTRKMSRPVLLDDAHQALLFELGDLCQWMNQNDDAARYIELIDVPAPRVERKAARKTRK